MANKTPKIPDRNRPPLRRVTGDAVFSGDGYNRFVLPLPPVKGPIRARAYQESKQPNAPALDHHGTPELPSQPRPPRD